MPTIYGSYQIDISPEKFLDKCSAAELMEVDLLLNSPRFLSKMEEAEQSPPEIDE